MRCKCSGLIKQAFRNWLLCLGHINQEAQQPLCVLAESQEVLGIKQLCFARCCAGAFVRSSKLQQRVWVIPAPIRSLFVGADKLQPYCSRARQHNPPALCVRAVLCMQRFLQLCDSTTAWQSEHSLVVVLLLLPPKCRQEGEVHMWRLEPQWK